MTRRRFLGGTLAAGLLPALGSEVAKDGSATAQAGGVWGGWKPGEFQVHFKKAIDRGWPDYDDPVSRYNNEERLRIYRDIMAVRGCASVYFPLPAYHYAQTSIYDYAKFAKTSAGEATKRLLQLAKAAGGCGVVMECVDYRNYTPEVCAAIGEFLR